jgi:hypothetical protein
MKYAIKNLANAEMRILHEAIKAVERRFGKLDFIKKKLNFIV